MKTRVFYLRDENRFPVACVATVKCDSPQEMYVAVSTHNPQDQYNREVGRSLALGRLQQPITVILVPTLPVKRQLLNMLAANKSLPQRTRNAAARMLHDWVCGI